MADVSIEQLCRDLLECAKNDGILGSVDPQSLSSGDLVGVANMLCAMFDERRSSGYRAGVEAAVKRLEEWRDKERASATRLLALSGPGYANNDGWNWYGSADHAVRMVKALLEEKPKPQRLDDPDVDFPYPPESKWEEEKHA